MATIEIMKHGPLLVKDPVTLIDKETGREVRVEKFPAALCRCGESANKPFCDGSHSSCDFDGTLAESG